MARKPYEETNNTHKHTHSTESIYLGKDLIRLAFQSRTERPGPREEEARRFCFFVDEDGAGPPPPAAAAGAPPE